MLVNIIVAIIIAYVIAILFGSNLYKKRVIEDYEARFPMIYQKIVDDVNELKSFLDCQERASRETLIRNKLNEMGCKYSAMYRHEKNK